MCIALRGIFSIFFLVSSVLRLSAAVNPDISLGNQAYQKLQQLSVKNFNIGVSEDSLSVLCRQVEAFARQEKNTAMEFKAGQMLVNAYGLAGNFALAVSKAQQLLAEAGKHHNDLATGLAIQAVGDTYMCTGRFERADSVFKEAAPFIEGHGDDFIKIQLMFQRLHVYSALQDTVQMDRMIATIETLLADSDLPAKEYYEFLISCYTAVSAIQKKEMELAGRLFSGIEQKNTSGKYPDLWVYYIGVQYYTFSGEYEKALSYNDSILNSGKIGMNGNIQQKALLSKAVLLEKCGDKKEACSVYGELFSVSDSLFQLKYTEQIDSLHVAYRIDQMLVSSMADRTTLYARIIGGLLCLVLVTVVIVFIIRRKNRQLEDSRRRLEALRASSAASIHSKSMFLSNMSHELRTPLNAITGFSSLLTDEEEMDPAERLQFGDYIRQNADLLLKLINDVVDISGLKGDNIRFTYAPCDVVMLCRNVVETVDKVKQTQAALAFTTSLEKLELNTDKNRLQQVLINLLVNATKFTAMGKITLNLYVDSLKNEAVFVVEDTGCGIPPEKQPHIFERFEKLHEGIQGAGLGLSICQLIVKHFGGRIWIDPEYKEGARFIFSHPLTKQKEPGI